MVVDKTKQTPVEKITEDDRDDEGNFFWNNTIDDTEKSAPINNFMEKQKVPLEIDVNHYQLNRFSKTGLSPVKIHGTMKTNALLSPTKIPSQITTKSIQIECPSSPMIIKRTNVNYGFSKSLHSKQKLTHDYIFGEYTHVQKAIDTFNEQPNWNLNYIYFNGYKMEDFDNLVKMTKNFKSYLDSTLFKLEKFIEGVKKFIQAKQNTYGVELTNCNVNKSMNLNSGDNISIEEKLDNINNHEQKITQDNKDLWASLLTILNNNEPTKPIDTNDIPAKSLLRQRLPEQLEKNELLNSEEDKPKRLQHLNVLNIKLKSTQNLSKLNNETFANEIDFLSKNNRNKTITNIDNGIPNKLQKSSHRKTPSHQMLKVPGHNVMKFEGQLPDINRLNESINNQSNIIDNSKKGFFNKVELRIRSSSMTPKLDQMQSHVIPAPPIIQKKTQTTRNHDYDLFHSSSPVRSQMMNNELINRNRKELLNGLANIMDDDKTQQKSPYTQNIKSFNRNNMFKVCKF